jgi:hypothetical protein
VEKFGATAIYAGEFSAILRRLDAPAMDQEDGDFDWSSSRGGGSRISKTERRRQDKLKKLRLP